MAGKGYLPISRGGTGVGSFTNGSIPFIFNGVFSEDNSNFYWDNINKRLGIGTASPTQSLEVTGSTWIRGDIHLGINTGNGVGHIYGPNAPNGSLKDGTSVVVEGGIGDSSGGYVRLNGGQGRSGDGGNAYIWGGDGGLSGGNRNGGSVEFRIGRKSGSGSYGEYRFLNPAQTTFGIFDFSLLSGTNKTFTFPDFTGTFGLLEVNQTWSGLNKFEANTNSTIYVGSSVKSGCIALGDSDGSGVTYVTANDGVLTASTTKPSVCQ